MTHSTAIVPPSASTQREKILAVLATNFGEWVPLAKIVCMAAQYSARIHELRGAGYQIANQTRNVGGKRHSWFRLEAYPGTRVAEQSPLPFAAKGGSR